VVALYSWRAHLAVPPRRSLMPLLTPISDRLATPPCRPFT